MIYTLTLNPAVDHLIYLSSLQINTINRIQRPKKSVGGKGTHVSINLKSMGIASTALGVAYGLSGRYIIDKLRSFGVDVDFFYSPEGENRNCYIITESETGHSTTLAEQGLFLAGEEESWILDTISKNVRKDDWFVLAGDSSNVRTEFFSALMKLLRDLGVRLFFDASGATLKSGLHFQPYLIKPNRDELEDLCGHPIKNENDVLQAFIYLEKFGIEYIAVSLGSEGSIVRTPNAIYKAVPPEVDVNNSAGCGDAFLAGLIYAFSQQLPIEEGLRIATSISAATANFELSVGYDQVFAEKIKSDCQVHRIQ